MWVIHHLNPCGLNSYCIIREPFLVKSRDCVAVAMSAPVSEEIDYTSASSNGSRKRKQDAGPDELGRYEQSRPNHPECKRCGNAKTNSGQWRQIVITPVERHNYEKCSMCWKYAYDEYEFAEWWCVKCIDLFMLFANRYDR